MSADPKQCRDCGQLLPRSEFHPHLTNIDNLRGECKKCCYARQAIWRKKNRDLIQQKNKSYYEANKEKCLALCRNWVARNPEKVQSYKEKHRKPVSVTPPDCPNHGKHAEWKKSKCGCKWWCQKCTIEKILLRARIQYSKKAKPNPAPKPLCLSHGEHGDWKHNKYQTKWWCQKCTKATRAKVASARRKRLKQKYCPANPIVRRDNVDPYYARNRERLLAKAKESWHLRSKVPGFKIKHNIRKRVRLALRMNPMRTVKLIGCTAGQLREWIQAQFSPEMHWNNYGTVWVVDHVFPLAKFDLTQREHLLAACHYTNLQPLLREDNAKKRDKMPTALARIMSYRKTQAILEKLPPMTP